MDALLPPAVDAILRDPECFVKKLWTRRVASCQDPLQGAHRMADLSTWEKLGNRFYRYVAFFVVVEE